MSDGIGKVRWDRPKRFVEAAAAGAEHLGLTDLAAVIRRIGTDPDEDCGWRLEALYFVLSPNEFGGADYAWLSGPNPGYGFGVSPNPNLSLDEHMENTRGFLAHVDPPRDTSRT